MYIAVSEIFCAHIIKMVRSLQSSPVRNDFFVVGLFDFLLKAIKLVNSVGLHSVSDPGREVPFDISPAYDVRHINRINGLVKLHYFAWSFEVVVGVLENLMWQMPHKIEYSGIFPLVFAECLIVHEKIDHVAVAVDITYPVSEFICRQRPLCPVTIGKSKGDVITQRIVFQ